MVKALNHMRANAAVDRGSRYLALRKLINPPCVKDIVQMTADQPVSDFDAPRRSARINCHAGEDGTARSGLRLASRQASRQLILVC
jgi:hypothetical protein